MSLPLEEQSSIRRDLFRLAWPLVLQCLFQTVMFLVDTWMIGWVGSRAQASMGLVGPLTHTMSMLLSAVGVGTLATVSRAVGEGDRGKVEREAATALVVSIAVGGVVAVLGPFLLPMLLGLFEVPGSPEVAAQARPYIGVMALGAPFLMLEISASNILRASGDSRTPMLVELLGIGLNIFFNWVLIFGNLGAPRLEILGAGLATAIAFSVQGVLLTAILLKRAIRPAALREVTRESAVRLLRVAGPALMEPLVIQSGFLAFLKIITLLGPASLAAHRAAVSVESLSFMPAYGISVACAALVGRFLGARRADKAEASYRMSARWAAYFMSALGVIYVTLPVFLIGLFIRDDRVILLTSAMCLGLVAFEQPFMALAMVLAGALRGAGDTRSPVLVAVIGVWAVRVPVAYVLALPCGLGIYGIWITMTVDWAVRALVLALLLRRGRWKEIRL